jgi:HEAT repeats
VNPTCWTLVTLLLASGQPAATSGDDVGNDVVAAFSAYPASPDRARRELLAVGGKGVPHLVRMLWCQDELAVPAGRFLLGVIEGIQAPEANRGLRALLSHPDPNLRGESAAALGRRKAAEAMIALLDLLDDEAVYALEVRTHPRTETPILVCDKAVEALEAITGTVRARGAPSHDKVAAWRWWRDQRLR